MRPLRSHVQREDDRYRPNDLINSTQQRDRVVFRRSSAGGARLHWLPMLNTGRPTRLTRHASKPKTHEAGSTMVEKFVRTWNNTSHMSMVYDRTFCGKPALFYLNYYYVQA